MSLSNVTNITSTSHPTTEPTVEPTSFKIYHSNQMNINKQYASSNDNNSNKLILSIVIPISIIIILIIIGFVIWKIHQNRVNYL